MFYALSVPLLVPPALRPLLTLHAFRHVLSLQDGRATICMPHPERVFRSVCNSWRPDDGSWGEDGPWMRMFRNARKWTESKLPRGVKRTSASE